MPEIQVPVGARGASVEIQVLDVNGKPKGPPEILCTHLHWADKIACKLGQCPLRRRNAG